LADGAFENDWADSLDAEFGEFFDEPVETVAFGDADGDNDSAGFGRVGSADGFDIEGDDIFSYSGNDGCRESAIAIEKLDPGAGAESQDGEVMGLGSLKLDF
jgi:hypothetical protein